MTITFDGETLFDSGSARVHAGGRSLHHAETHPLHSQGVRVFGQGRSGRSITQTGTLLADSVEMLQAQIEAIEVKLDGLPHPLVDHLGRNWSNTVMLAFEPEATVPAGARWQVRYRIEYVQVTAN